MRLCNRSSVVILCAVAGILARPSALFAQLSDLPVKAGLWETNVSTKAGTSNITGTAPVCFTAGTTMGDYLTATNKGVAGAKCDVSHKVDTAHAISYDTVCSGDGVVSKGRIEVQLTDVEHFSGASHTTVTRTAHGKPLDTTVDKTFTAKFLGSACGNVKPLVEPAPRAK